MKEYTDCPMSTTVLALGRATGVKPQTCFFCRLQTGDVLPNGTAGLTPATAHLHLPSFLCLQKLLGWICVLFLCLQARAAAPASWFEDPTQLNLAWRVTNLPPSPERGYKFAVGLDAVWAIRLGTNPAVFVAPKTNVMNFNEVVLDFAPIANVGSQCYLTDIAILNCQGQECRLRRPPK